MVCCLLFVLGALPPGDPVAHARAAAAQFLNPMILVKKGGKLPEGHIQSWFWERGNLKDSLPLKLPAGAAPLSLGGHEQGCLLNATTNAAGRHKLKTPASVCSSASAANRCAAQLTARGGGSCLVADIASKVKVGQTEFKRYPENLLNSRVRYGRAFQVRP